jgi:hypothetical protein
MKINKWTLGLAAVGLVSLTSVVRAEEAKTTPLLTALSATTISGYVDTSAVWAPGTGNANQPPVRFLAGKADGFNLDSVDVRIAKPLEEGQWSSGFVVDLFMGPDSQVVNQGDTAAAGFGNTEIVRQAYLNLRMPVGNGIDWKIGRFDCALGYESTDAYKDPNWSRSYGYTFEPTEHTGIWADYKVSDMFSIGAGVANTVTTGTINQRNAAGSGGTTVESKKAVMGLINFTAPESWGVMGGSGLYAGIDYGPGSNGGINTDGTFSSGRNRTHVYVGGTIKTPIKDLTLGAAWDSVNHMDVAGVDTGYNMAVAAYASFRFTDKASLHVRGEYARGAALGALADEYNGLAVDGFGTPIFSPLRKVIAVTGTLQYDLWQNVISRLEVRWDHQADGNASAFGGVSSPAVVSEPVFPDAVVTGDQRSGGKKNNVLVAANLIFKF